MTRFLLLAASLLVLTNCGIQRPLVAPKEIPAYEERLRRKRERLEDTPAAQAQPAPQQTTEN